jgi:hypothetical protein
VWVVWLFVRYRSPEVQLIACFTPLIVMFSAIAVCVIVLQYGGTPWRMTFEPVGLFSGISAWPGELLKWVAAMLCVFCVWLAIIETWRNDERLEKAFKLDSLLSEPRTPKGHGKEPNFIRDELEQESHRPSAYLGGWRVFGNDTSPRAYTRPQDPGPKSNDKVYAQNLWWEYLRRAHLGSRALRVLPLALVLYLAVLFGVRLFGMPLSPIRGSFARGIDCLLTWWIVGPVATVFLVFVLDSTYLNSRFVRYLASTNTHWPGQAAEQFSELRCRPHDLTEYMDVRFIAARTQVVGRFIYYPFLIFFLLILSRNSLFDDWDWPAGLVIVYGLSLCFTIGGALGLRQAAEEARERAVRKMTDRRIGFLTGHPPKDAESNGQYSATTKEPAPAKPDDMANVMDVLIEEVRNERTGAFSILSQYPTLAAILLPTGSVTLWALLEYLGKTLG